MADEENKMKAEVEESKTEAAEAVAQETQATSAVAQEEKAEAEVEAPKEEPKQEAKPAEVKETTKPSKDLAPKLAKIATEIEGLTVLELSELAGYLEEKFGVTAMAVAAPAGGGAAPAGAAEPAEEKSTFNVILKDAGANKLAVIKAVREVKPDLGLMDAKKLVESAPKEVAQGMKKEDAQEAKKKLEDAGGTVELQ